MKKTFVIFVLLLMPGCRSEKIDLTGKFDVVLNNKAIAVLTLKQIESKLTGFFEWNNTGSDFRTIYEITGTCTHIRKTKTATVIIYVKKDKESMYVLNGKTSDSNSILGSFEQRPGATRHFVNNKQSCMAIRKN